MDFSLTHEHQMAQKMVRDFAQKEIAPVIKEYDRKQEPIPFALKRMGELGILGICFPVRYGGQGMDYISWGLACEELESLDTSLRVAMSVHTGLCSMSIFQWGTEEQKQKFLVPLAKGEKIGCGAFTEPGMGSDVAAMTTSAKLDGDHYILNGEKMWISLASKADLALVTVKTNFAARKPSDGLSSFIIDLRHSGDLFLNELVFCNWLAKGLARPGVIDTGFKRRTNDAGRARCHGIASVVKACHGDVESLAFLAKPVCNWHFYICERDPACCASAHTQFPVQVTRFYSLTVQVNDERRQTV